MMPTVLAPTMRAIPMPSHSTTDATTPSLYWPSQADRMPTRCRHCTARLLVSPSDIPTATDPLHDITCLMCARVACQLQHDGLRDRIPSRALPADAPARIGRPPTRMGRPVGTLAAPRHPCADCPTMVEADHERCRDCHNANRFTTSHAGRLVAILGDGVWRHRADLCLSLGVTVDGLKGAIDRARSAGHVVTYQRGFYRLEMAP
jgi:hypothetical protein